MNASEMLKHTLRLEAQPGGVRPELRLKKNTTSSAVMLIIPPGTALANANKKRCVIRATLPNGTELFETGFTEMIRREVAAEIQRPQVTRMTAAEGSYKCTLTILDTTEAVSRETYMNYDFLTVLPFTVNVYKRA